MEKNNTNEKYQYAKMYLPHKVAKLTSKKDNEEYKKKMYNSGNYFAQVKKDGFYLTIEKDSQGNCWAFGRNISKDGYLKERGENIPHIIDFLDSKIPNGTILIGELYTENGTSKDVAKLYNCKKEKSLERQKDNKLKFYLFDVLSYDEVDFVELKGTHYYRYQTLKEKVKELKLLDNENITFAKAVLSNLDKFVQNNFDKGEEGTILRNKNAIYQPNKRPVDSIIKIKIKESHDVVCVGFIPPTEKYSGTELDSWIYFNSNNEPITKAHYKGWIGAIEYGVYKDGELTSIGRVSSGLSDNMLIDIKLNPDKYMGKPFEIGAMSVDKSKLRHPRILRWRDDIDVLDCTYDKIFK